MTIVCLLFFPHVYLRGDPPTPDVCGTQSRCVFCINSPSPICNNVSTSLIVFFNLHSILLRRRDSSCMEVLVFAFCSLANHYRM
ncbi:hypothetical protein KC19_6G071000 [Ceratodon purpureus]|uniref:Secreted protein n=1 Tax=Ceratodon purpureus TaxID=3225 RepID=A0A8T0HCG1_CERPU|nr:hypothetical protein KC19_6G071000 [Ceratodon purpureus]